MSDVCEIGRSSETDSSEQLLQGVLYLTLVSIPIVFKQIYGFNTGEAGLVYITQTLGSAIGIIADGYCNRLYLKNVAKRGPEARLFTAFVGGVCVPLGAFIYAFTAYPQCHWIGCCVGITILCTFVRSRTPPSFPDLVPPLQT